MPSPTHRLLVRVIPVVRRSGEVDDAAKVRREVLERQARADSSPPRRRLRGCTVTERDGLGFPVHEVRPEGRDP
ncbi:MAG: hypothetical protein ACTHKG_09015, partial [Nocardioides sp.]